MKSKENSYKLRENAAERWDERDKKQGKEKERAKKDITHSKEIHFPIYLYNALVLLQLCNCFNFAEKVCRSWEFTAVLVNENSSDF